MLAGLIMLLTLRGSHLDEFCKKMSLKHFQNSQGNTTGWLHITLWTRPKLNREKIFPQPLCTLNFDRVPTAAVFKNFYGSFIRSKNVTILIKSHASNFQSKVVILLRYTFGMITLPFSVVVSVITIWEPMKFEKENLTSSNIGKLYSYQDLEKLITHKLTNQCANKFISNLQVEQNLFRVKKIHNTATAIRAPILPKIETLFFL